MQKLALHSYDRGKERLGLSPESVKSLQSAADRMLFGGGNKKLTGAEYYSCIRDPNKNLLGYAAFKRINNQGNRPRLILASILSKSMKPRGNNISQFLDHTIKDNNTALDIPSSYSGLPPIPNNPKYPS